MKNALIKSLGIIPDWSGKKISEIGKLATLKDNPDRIKQLLFELKTIAEGTVGSLIASGIVGLINGMVL